jgi:peroxiredoxin
MITLRYRLESSSRCCSIWLVALLLLLPAGLVAQDAYNKLPQNVEVQTMEGKRVKTSAFENDGDPMIISFWAMWCKPCLRELSQFHEDYPDLQAETGVKVIAVSIDDARNTPRVKSFVRGKGWNFPVYLDPNSAFKRAMNVNNIPHTFLVNGQGEVVYQHSSYTPGDEIELYEELDKLVQQQADKPAKAEQGQQ